MHKRIIVGREGVPLSLLVMLLLFLAFPCAVQAQSGDPVVPEGAALVNGASADDTSGEGGATEAELGVSASTPGVTASAPGTAASAPGTAASASGTAASASGIAASASGSSLPASGVDTPGNGQKSVGDGLTNSGYNSVDSFVEGVKETVQDAVDLVRDTVDQSATKVKKVGKDLFNALTQKDEDFFVSKPCSFQIVDNMGRTVKTTNDCQLSFQMQPGENGRYLNGKREVELDSISVDPSKWLPAEPVGDTGVFTADLLVPVSEDSSVKVTYNVRFAGTGKLAATSLETNSLVLTHRGTEHDVEVLRLLQTVRQDWEWPLAWSCCLLTLAAGWFRAASAKERTWQKLTSERKVKADVEANKKYRRKLFMAVACAVVGLVVVAFFPGVQGIQGMFPYCGVWLGSLLPLLLVLLLG